MSDCVIRSRVDIHIKDKSTKLFAKMGLSMSEAIRLFLYQALAEKALPFKVSIPNKETIAALQEIKDHPGKLEKTSLKQLEKDWNAARA